MHGIIGAFFGLIFSLFIILLLNASELSEKATELISNPIYLIFILSATIAGLIIGYLTRLIGKDKAFHMKFESPINDTIVIATGILAGTIMKGRAVFVLIVLLFWLTYRSIIIIIFRLNKNSSEGKKQPKE
jgi:hypothetical protein